MFTCIVRSYLILSSLAKTTPLDRPRRTATEVVAVKVPKERPDDPCAMPVTANERHLRRAVRSLEPNAWAGIVLT